MLTRKRQRGTKGTQKGNEGKLWNTKGGSEILRSYGIKSVLKEVWPVVSIGDEIYWVPGIRKSDSLIDYEKSGKSNIITASIEKSSIEDY